jgi:TRAP-type C4-dicarboxylate transport system permease large subunit
MDLSLSGLIGAMIGALLGAINSVAIIAYADGWLRSRNMVQTAEERAAFEERVTVMRRSILALNIAICAGIGYWFGKTVGG